MTDLSPEFDEDTLVLDKAATEMFDAQAGISPPSWLEAAAAEAWIEAQRLLTAKRKLKELRQYAADPVAFGIDVLHESYTEEVKSVMRSVQFNPVTIARSANATGKSHGAARVAIWFLCVFEDAQVYITAAPPLDNLKRILWGQIGMLIEKHPALMYGFKIRSMKIIRNAQSFMDGVAISTSGTEQEREAKFSGKHAPHLLFIVDEADAVPPEVYRGIESCMSGGVARLLCMFNPRVQYGPVYEKEFNRQANVIELSAFTHPNVVTGEDVFPGAVSREMTIRRINEWTREAAPDEKIDESFFEVPDFLVGKSSVSLDGREYPPLPPGFRKIKEAAFSYMVLGKYPPLGTNQLISDVWIQNARRRWDEYVARRGEVPPQGVQPIIGLDVAELGSDANALCARYGNFVAKIKTWGYVDADVTATKSLNYYRDLSAQLAFVDATGVGSSVAPSMSRQGRKDPNKVRAVSIKVAGKPLAHIKSDMGEFYRLRDQLWWMTREWLRTDPEAMLPPDPLLVEELKTPTYEIPKGEIVVMDKKRMRELLHRSPDRADALCLTFSPIARPKWERIG